MAVSDTGMQTVPLALILHYATGSFLLRADGSSAIGLVPMATGHAQQRRTSQDRAHGLSSCKTYRVNVCVFSFLPQLKRPNVVGHIRMVRAVKGHEDASSYWNRCSMAENTSPSTRASSIMNVEVSQRGCISCAECICSWMPRATLHKVRCGHMFPTGNSPSNGNWMCWLRMHEQR
jgi:hypothetical protein